MSISCRYARQLELGMQLLNVGNHHSGMAELKRQLGNPRPEGRTASGKRPLYTLSLINPDSPSCYDGFRYPGGSRVSYRLSTDPADYAWETFGENAMRKPEEVRHASKPIGFRIGTKLSPQTKAKISCARKIRYRNDPCICGGHEETK